MSSHNTLHELFSDACPYVIADPGNAGTLTCDRQMAMFKLTSAAAETRTLAQPTKPGIMCAVVVDVYVGDITLTVTGGYNQAAATSLTLGTAGDWVLFYSVEVGTSYYWRVIASEGVNVTRTDITATTGTITTLGATTADVTTLTATSLKLAVTALNATGSVIGNAAALSAGLNVVALADNTTGVQLPVASTGLVVLVKSTAASKILKVYPQVNSAIDALGANNAYSTAAVATGAAVMFVAQNATTWRSMPGDVT